jgi:hypothetical protein
MPTIATHCDRILQRYFCESAVAEGIMSGQIPRPFGSIALVATLLVSAVGVGVAANTVRADDCLAAPNSPAPPGSHWYYRLDWATQRKCWYVRAGDAALRSPHVKKLAVNPKSAQAITATTGKLLRRTEQEGNAAPSMKAPAWQVSTSSQPSAQAAGPVSVAPLALPDAPPAVATAEAREVSPTDPPANSLFDVAETTTRSGATISNSRMPMIIVLALGLAMVGTLSRGIIKNAAARYARNVIDHRKPGRVDDQRQHGWRGGQDQHGPVDERQALISAVSDYGLSRAESDAFSITYEINRRRFKLAQLRQRLEGLLQLPARPHDEPLPGQAVAC